MGQVRVDGGAHAEQQLCRVWLLPPLLLLLLLLLRRRLLRLLRLLLLYLVWLQWLLWLLWLLLGEDLAILDAKLSSVRRGGGLLGGCSAWLPLVLLLGRLVGLPLG